MIIGIGIPFGRRRAGSAFDADLEAYLARVSTQPSAANILVLQEWITQLKAAIGSTNLTTAFDYIGLRAVTTAADSLLNFMSSSHAAAYAGGLSASDWVANQGFSTDGVAKRLLVDYNPATEAVNYTLNNASVYMYTHAYTNVNGRCLIGLTDPSGNHYTENRIGVTSQEVNVSSGSVNGDQFTKSRLVQRNTSTVIRVYNDGAPDSANPITSNSNTIPNADISEGAATFGATAFNYSAVTIFSTFVGRAFTDTEAADIDAAFDYLYTNLT
jgi:hypothetical protein